MTDLHQKNWIIHQLNTLGDQVDERWNGLTTKQVEDIKAGIEGLWQVVCRRKVSR